MASATHKGDTVTVGSRPEYGDSFRIVTRNGVPLRTVEFVPRSEIEFKCWRDVAASYNQDVPE